MQANFINRFIYFPSEIGSIVWGVEEAKAIVKNNVCVLSSKRIALTEAAGYVLAEDVFSKTDFPPFNQSNVDGYAIAFKDAQETLIINGEAAAGNNKSLSLQPKHAMRIFTGAAIPENADTVVMQEKVVVENGALIIKDEQLQQGLNFRPKAKDIKQDALALNKDEYLSAGAIGFLSALGITEVNVFGRPSISIIITGNELRQPGQTLQYGEVYEANSFMLRAALQQLHFNDAEVFYYR
jgi:molybdopterin molybdotransferase